MPITEVTRRNIFDALTLARISWCGRLDDMQFLGRLYDLDSLPSTDRRYSTATSDIECHRIGFRDWQDDWVYYDSRFGLQVGADEVFLRFLSEMLHPVVRPDAQEASRLANEFNQHLRADGWEIVPVTEISGHPVFAARQLLSAELPGLEQLAQQADALDSSVLSQQITRLRAAADGDPALAIGTAKELVETVCRSALSRAGRAVHTNPELPELVQQAMATVGLLPQDVPQGHPGARSLRTLYGTLSTMCQSLAELRNLFGTGHGPADGAPQLEPRHARLAASAAIAFVLFLHASLDGRQSP